MGCIPRAGTHRQKSESVGQEEGDSTDESEGTGDHDTVKCHMSKL